MKKKPKKAPKKNKKRALVQNHLPFPLICDRCGKKIHSRDKVACAKCAQKIEKETAKA